MKIIGHRGAAGLAPQNTLAAVKKALEVGVDEVEIDLRVTKDQQVVVAHDAFIADNHGKQHMIENCTLQELRSLKADLALFIDVAKTVNRKKPLLVEVKPRVNTVPIITDFEQLLSSGWHSEDFRIGSFSQHTLKAMHQALPDIEPIVIERFSGIRATWRARHVNATRLSMSRHVLWWFFIRQMKKGGFELYAYTVNNPKKAHKWARYGLAGVITDRPDLFTK